MQTTRHAIDWFEIPGRDMARATAFDEVLLATPIRRETMTGDTLGRFDRDEIGVGGCLMAGENAPVPSTSGALVYPPAGPSLDAVLARVEAIGGRVTRPKVTLPGDMGRFAHITDTEGNRVGLHAPH